MEYFLTSHHLVFMFPYSKELRLSFIKKIIKIATEFNRNDTIAVALII